jgi:hypothetical protein
MDRKWIIGGVVLVLIVLVIVNLGGEVEKVSDINADEISEEVEEIFEEEVDFEDYNFEFADDEVKKAELSKAVRGKSFEFYLPDVDYINVSSGGEFGVMYALNNVNPSDEDYFVLNWSASEESCGVGLDEAYSWIERGWTSFGRVPEGWIDHLVVYFDFPEGVSNCGVEYAFVLEKNGAVVGNKNILFNIA